MTAPAVTSISPASGPLAGGTVVSILGTALGTPTAVAFGATPATDFAEMSATQVVAVAPAGTGLATVTVTTAGGVSVDAVQYQYVSGLFTVAEARAFDKGQLADAEKYPDAAIVAKEAEIREFLTEVCGADFFPTTHTDEYLDGDGSCRILLKWPLVTSLTAVSTRSGSTWTPLTADQLAQLQPSDTGLVTWEWSYWPWLSRSVKVTYVAGHAAVPDAIKDAALRIAVSEIPTSNVPMSAESYDAGGMSISYANGDGYNGAWHRIAEVRRAIRLYSQKMPGVA